MSPSHLVIMCAHAVVISNELACCISKLSELQCTTWWF